MVDRIFDNNNKYIGMVWEKQGKWRAMVCPARKNIKTKLFKTCGNGIVRMPTDKSNQCSDAMTWDTKEKAVVFLNNINFLLDNAACFVVLRNDGEFQEIRGIFYSEVGAKEQIMKDVRANPDWAILDFVIQEEEVKP